MLPPLATDSPEAQSLLEQLADRFETGDPELAGQVAEIIENVRQRGDEALIEYSRRFDGAELTPERLRVSESELEQAVEAMDDEFYEALDLAVDRIIEFHEHEKERSWMITRPDGAVTGRLVIPVDAAGLYVPGGQGGKTPLVSSVLMNGIPAGIAGVAERIMVTPPDPQGGISPALLAAAVEIGITDIYKAGSAWAIAALAFGTETIPPVDVIVGPGNRFVTEAKRQVAGRVRIDMIAGPSEVLIIADPSADPSLIAADMLAQAEHDPDALAICIATSLPLAQEVAEELRRQVEGLEREAIARKALEKRGALLVADDLAEAVSLANDLAPEHLELMVQDPWTWVTRVRHAGAIFLGRFTPESAGDYIAGPNHVLPTMGTARFSSALGVETFVKKSSLISYSPEALAGDLSAIELLARLEGLTAHANSALIRAKRLRQGN